jgi:Ca2+-binding EF-hand superfamily protein
MELLTEEEISEFREIFNLVDKDGGGSITGEELGELMDTLGIEASPEEIDAMIREVISLSGIISVSLSIFRHKNIFHYADRCGRKR